MSQPCPALPSSRRRWVVLLATSLAVLLTASTAAATVLERTGPPSAPPAAGTVDSSTDTLPDPDAPAPMDGAPAVVQTQAASPPPAAEALPQTPGDAPTTVCSEVGGLPVCRHDHGPSTAAARSGGGAAPRAPLACEGDGRSGNRFRVIYVRRTDRPDRLGALLGELRRSLEVANAVVTRSSNGARSLRVVTEGGCQASIASVTLSPAQTAGFDETARALRAVGHARIDRKYVVFVDDDRGCGMGEQYADDRPTLLNRNNDGDTYAAVYPRCWDGVTLAHELVHMLGGVQASAPHSTGPYGHCTDGADVMCYRDGSGRQVSARCPAAHAALLDCGRDDYFAVDPPAGSYLTQRWNTASSSFLVGGGPPVPLAPSPPRGVRSTTEGRTATVRWDVPDQARSGVSSYTVVDLARAGQPLATVDGTARSAPITLEVWREYRLAVRAANPAGASAAAGDVRVMVGTAPSAPLGVLATYTASGTDAQNQVTWSGVAYSVGYRVLRNGRPVAETRGTAWVDRTPLPLGSTVTYTVQAWNAWGTSPTSAPSTVLAL